MKVTVKTVSKEEHAVEVDGASTTVGELRKAACEKMTISTGAALTLVHLGAVLNDDSKTLEAHGIADGAVLVAVIKKARTANSPAAAAPAPAPVPALAPASAATPATSADAGQSSGKMIRLTVSDIDGDVRVIEVEDNELVENVKAVLEVEFAVPMAQQALFFEAKQLDNGKRLNEAGVKNDDMLMMQAMRASAARPASAARQQGAGAGRVGGLDLAAALAGALGGGALSARNPLQAHMNEANQLLQMAAADPHLLRRVQDNNKPLADAIATGKADEVAKQLLQLAKEKRDIEFKKQQAIMRLNADPFDVEAQKEIEEMVRMENVNQNLEQVRQLHGNMFVTWLFHRSQSVNH